MSASIWKYAVGTSLFIFLTTVLWFTAAGQSVNASLASADAAMRAGRFADAAREYEAWLKAHPASKEVLFALGVCYVQLGQQSEAVATLRRYVRLAPSSAPGYAALGIALLDGAKTAEAKTALQTAVRLNPKQVDAAEALARIYLVEGKANEAVSLLRPLVSSGATAETQVLLAEGLVKAGQAQTAAVMLAHEIETDPNSTSRMYAATAWAYLKVGDLVKAAEICERGMRIYPDSEIEVVYLSLPAPYLAERIGARTERLQQAPDVAELIALGRVLVDADPAHRTRANEIAQRMLAHAVELQPDNVSAHYNYGRALRRNSLELALTEWKKALTLNPDGELRLQILIKIGAAKIDASDFEGANDAFREALEVNRKLSRRNPEAMLEYVHFLQLRSRTGDAETLLNEILSWNPLSPRAHAERAKLLVARRQWLEVVSEGEFVLRNAGDDEELLRTAHVLLARAYLGLNQPEKAQLHKSWIDSH